MTVVYHPERFLHEEFNGITQATASKTAVGSGREGPVCINGKVLPRRVGFMLREIIADLVPRRPGTHKNMSVYRRAIIVASGWNEDTVVVVGSYRTAGAAK